MAEFEIVYVHNGTPRTAVLYADSHREAFEQLQSLKAFAVIGERLEGRIDAGLTDEQIERLRA